MVATLANNPCPKKERKRKKHLDLDKEREVWQALLIFTILKTYLKTLNARFIFL
jgi:hypothetical protein